MESTQTSAPPAALDYARPPVQRRLPLPRLQELGLLLVIFALWGTLAILAGGRFVNWGVQINYFKDTSIVAIMAVGMTAVIISGGIDLSVGSIYALAGVASAMVLQNPDPNSSMWAITLVGIATALAVAVGCGLINGIAVVGLKVHPFIITLGTMLVFRGVAFVATKARSIGNFPETFTDLARSNLGLHWLGVPRFVQPVPMLVMFAVTALGVMYLNAMVAGRHVYAVGGNLETARFSGLRTNGILVGVYVLVGLSAGVATTLANGIYGSASSARGVGYELRVIAAAVVGGASLSGGRGSAFGALLGALLIQLISQGISSLRIDQNYNDIIIGFAIVVAVVLDHVSRQLAERRLASAARVQAEPIEAAVETNESRSQGETR